MLSATLGLIALLISGLVCTNEQIQNVNLIEGDSRAFSVINVPLNVLTCHLETPRNETIDFLPGDVSQTKNSYEVLPGNSLSQCQIRVLNFNIEDSGLWTLYFTHEDGIGNAERLNVTVTPKDLDSDSQTETPATQPSTPVDSNDGASVLGQINHFTREGLFIDISLGKQAFEEECTVEAPGSKSLEDFVGVTVQDSSDYVSCRVTIGPMIQELLGTWRLCGISKSDGAKRCQPTNIAWNNNNPNGNWDPIEHPRFPHVVHYGGAVNPGVIGNGDLLTCHVITPANEDLVLTPEAQYPNIERVTQNPSLCSVVIGVTGERSLGNWTVVGIFRSVISGLNEVRLPMELSLYNEENPYEQAYNVTMLPNVNRVINIGNTIEIRVNGLPKVDRCEVTTPSGEKVYQKGSDTDGVIFSLESGACHVTLGPITTEMTGVWDLTGKFNDGIRFSEMMQPFLVIQEDPNNPLQEDHRRIINMDQRKMVTDMGETERITIAQEGLSTGESCHIRTPDGKQYTIMEGFNIDGVNVIEEIDVECGVTINLKSEELIGDWVLIARSLRISEPIERRLPFTIYVEEEVRAVPNQVNMTDGTDLYIRLEKPTHLFETCELHAPNGTNSTYEIDSSYTTSCGYIIKNVDTKQSGKWEIVYGNQIVYRAIIDVNIFATSPVSVEQQTWTLGTPVHTAIGPEDAVYCRLLDAKDYTVFDAFGRCLVEVERVTEAHQGVWSMSVGMPGTVMLQEVTFIVDVVEADSSVVVTTRVVREAPSVLLSCSVPAELEVHGCKFRDHRGNIMIVQQGVGQDGDTGNAVSTSIVSQVSTNTCTLRLRNPTAEDLGLWRCAVETAEETLYAFLNVTCPWLMQQPDAVKSSGFEPTLTRERKSIVSLESDSTVMSCHIDASIRYCYFRAMNGTIFNVRPGFESASFEYAGAGLHAGECGVRFNGLVPSDSGLWSCHVGLVDTTAQEQRAQFDVEIQERMRVSHFRSAYGGPVLEGAVHDYHPVEYCRFIRIDGLGFTSDNVPSGYKVDKSLMMNGYCVLTMEEPSMLNLHPWTVVAKLVGVNQEIAKTSDDDIMFEELPFERPGQSNVHMIFFWISCVLTLMALVSLCVALVPKKNRKWTYERAKSIRNSFKKTPLPSLNATTKVQNA